MNKQLELLKKLETKRQKEGIELIPSENYISRYVRSFLSSIFVNKYSEGYPHKRYYGGNEFVDRVELLAQDRAKKIFHVPYVNVQPYSGSPANLAVYLATCKPGDTIMGQSLTAGGHLTHGHFVSATGIFYKSVSYGVQRDLPELFNYAEIEKLIHQHKPKLFWVGATAHPLIFHYGSFARILSKSEAVVAADISHVAGLIAGGEHPSPIDYVDIVTTTTHKTLRGPRGAMIMITERGLKRFPDLSERINKAVFPGLQGGPHDNQTAAIAAALEEVDSQEFKRYAKQIVLNADLLAKELRSRGFELIGGKTENHLILADLSNLLSPGAGVFAQKALEFVGITVNKNTVPDEPFSPFYPSGIRIGTPAITTRGMKQKEMKIIARWIAETVDQISTFCMPKDKQKRMVMLNQFDSFIQKNKALRRIKQEVKTVATAFPLP